MLQALKARKVKTLTSRKIEKESNCSSYHRQQHNQHLLQTLIVKCFYATPSMGPLTIQQSVLVGRKRYVWKPLKRNAQLSHTNNARITKRLSVS